MEPKIMIRCPKTNKPLYTGMTMSQEVFESSTLENKTIGLVLRRRATHVEQEKRIPRMRIVATT
jgi:hypothetical protein